MSFVVMISKMFSHFRGADIKWITNKRTNRNDKRKTKLIVPKDLIVLKMDLIL